MNGFTYNNGVLKDGLENSLKSNRKTAMWRKKKPKYRKGDLLLTGTGTICDSNQKTKITGLEGPALCLDVFLTNHDLYLDTKCWCYLVLLNGVIKQVPERFVLRYIHE
tara:strand:- start:4 stop:327 length:324 start_codon:yes stop_codon:yes gene_type:complete